MKDRGYTVILDALLALVLIMVLFSGLWGSIHFKSREGASSSFKRLHYVSEDVLDVLNKKGVLDEVGEAWASAGGDNASGNWSYAVNVSRAYLEQLVPVNVGYRFYLEDDVLAENTSRVPEDSSVVATHAIRLLVGYGSGLPVRGETSRVYLSNIKSKTNSVYGFFGGFVGEGNITRNITLPGDMDTVIQAYLELNAGSAFELFVNGVSVGAYSPGAEDMSANIKDYVPTPGNYFTAGENQLELRFTGSDIATQYVGGGFIRVTYNTSSMETGEDTGESRYFFPGIEGVINHYSSFYVPGQLTNMSAFLHLRANYTTYLTIGNQLVYNQSLNGSEVSVTLTDENLSAILSYPGLSQKTTPIRLGMQNLSRTIEHGNADVVLTTDLSFSMWEDMCMDGDWEMIFDSNNPSLNDTAVAAQVCTSQCIRNDGLLCHYNDCSGSYPECCSCSYGCWRSFGCGQNPGSVCSLPCYECIWYGGHGNYTYDSSGGSYCYDCTNLGCTYCFDTTEVSEWCALSCGPTVYAYWGVNGTAADPYAPPPAGQCSLYRCTSYARASCTFYSHRACDQAYVHARTTYDFDGLPMISYLPCPNQCFACNLTGVGLAKQLDANFTERILNISGNRIGLVAYGDDSYSTHALSNDTSSLSSEVDSYFAGGETCVCCAINESITAMQDSNSSRLKFILAMTDGEANVRCGNAAADLDGDTQVTAKDDAIQAACTAYEDYNITVYAVGFGSSAGADTLQRIADCGNGTFYSANSSQDLEAIYNDIANEIIEAVYAAQAINLTFSYESILYPDSYIQFNYTPVNTTVYGEITIAANTERFNNTDNCTGLLYIPGHTAFIDAKVTSFSAQYWTDYVSADKGSGASVAYTLRDGSLGEDYSVLGDPFIVNIPLDLLASGVNNTITVETGTNTSNHTGCSIDDRVIYTLRMPRLVGYGDVFMKSIGCNWTIEFEDGSTMYSPIPSTYNESQNCYYTSGNSTGAYPGGDSYADAVARLLRNLDLDGDGRVDILFDETMIEFELARAGGVRSLWGPLKAKLVMWM
ncbi:MAG: VWA domain-containing protein [Candidatus Altiarchaeota archaeon]